MKEQSSRPRADEPVTYEVKVLGRLKAEWSDWFDGMSICFTGEADGQPITSITGPVKDQAALRGLLGKIWDLNLNLVSVNRHKPIEPLIGQPVVSGRGDRSDEQNHGTRDVN
jgi:hypothetical protein